MLKILFTKMELLKDNNTVKIFGDYLGHQVSIELSILQLAKIFGTDANIVKEVDFGTEEYEEKCIETREHIKNFPKMNVQNNILSLSNTQIKRVSENKLKMYVEDIVGWDNEGIRIEFPEDIFNQELKDGKLDVIIGSSFVELKTN